MFEQFRKSLSRVIYSARNSMTLPNQFLRWGNQKPMLPDWRQVMMSDPDHYTGYSYAAITKRARSVARIAADFLKTDVPDDTGDTEFEHPYIPLIRNSLLYSENQFWMTISTYLDLEGWFPLMVIRNPDGKKNPDGSGDLGKSLSFKLLNPYEVKRIIDQQTLEVAGYIETRQGMQREIPVEMIIDIRELNPFNKNEPYAMTDAARESSYTLKSSGDYTRHVLRNNVEAPGIITTDVILPENDFKNFVSRMKDHTKGEPVFGNGASAIKFTPMTSDLSKSALKDINEVNRDELFAVSGVSKTKMGIEQSGTTRETSNVQKDQFIEDEIVPRITTVLDALNLDYKNRYNAAYTKNQAQLGLNNPIDSDQDVEGKKIENKQAEFDLFTSLVDQGYDQKKAASFACGDITLEQLGKPKNPPKPDPLMPTQPVVTPTADPKAKKKSKNEISKSVIADQESRVQNSIVNIDQQLAVAAINRVPKKIKNDITEESDLITPTEKNKVVNELILVLTAFYGIIAALQGRETMKDRAEEYSLPELKFILDKVSKDNIKKMAEKVAQSHVDTVSADLYRIAKEGALRGASQQEIIGELKDKYSHDITENRARTIARTETNRAFTMAQYDADRQFIKENKLESRAFKRYETRSANPCAFCESLAASGLIPFDEPFVKKGQTVTAKVDGEEVKFDVNFENVFAGNLHPNCSCDYRLVIIDEK